MFKNQMWHFTAIVMSFIVLCMVVNHTTAAPSDSLWGLSSELWFIIAFSIPIVHQIYVAIVWRLELYKSFFTVRWGLSKAFSWYKIGFSILFVSRLLSIVFLSISDAYSFDVNTYSLYGSALILTPFSVYLFYSVKKYFTIDRAYGIDHFDKNYNVPYVKQGIFRFTNNGMYVFGLAILYIPGLLLASKWALYAALFNHLYIWVHYYTVERPDMDVIYGALPKKD